MSRRNTQWSMDKTLKKMTKKGYIVTKDNRLEHRVICREAHGPFPREWLVHHIDSNLTNNHPSNLIALPGKVYNSVHNLQIKYNMKLTRQQIDGILKSYVNLSKGKPLAVIINITVSQNQMVAYRPEITASVRRSGSSTYR